MTLQTIEFSNAKPQFCEPTAKSVPISNSGTPATLRNKDGSAAGKNSGHAPDPENYSNLLSLFDAESFQQHFQPDSTILLHGEPADAVYLIVSGTVRCCTINDEGCRQIFRFSKKGGFVGIADHNKWHFTAEAVDHVIVKSIPRAVFERALAINTALQQEMRTFVRKLLECRERQLLTLISTKAPDRLFQFLCDFTASKPRTGYVVLPMCRRDIADHLGLSVETVSRAFTELKRKGHIELATTEKYRICDVA